MKPKGCFITLEGGEGAGKSSLLSALTADLQSAGYQVVVTREPGGTSLGETIRHWLLSNTFSLSDQAELLLFLAARAQHIDEVIKPALEKGQIVLCDRFNDSTIAYQGEARGLDKNLIKQLCQIVCGSIQPDLTLFLDVDPEIGLLRTQKLNKDHAASGAFDRIESETLHFHKKVRLAFQQLAKEEPQRIKVINANQGQAIVIEESLAMVQQHLQKVQHGLLC
jgi:dTMP kinase